MSISGGGRFAPVSIRCFFHSLFAMLYLTRHKPSGTVAAPRWQLAHRLIAAAFRAEYALVPPWVPGNP
jgi:hypothetical protein